MKNRYKLLGLTVVSVLTVVAIYNYSKQNSNQNIDGNGSLLNNSELMSLNSSSIGDVRDGEVVQLIKRGDKQLKAEIPPSIDSQVDTMKKIITSFQMQIEILKNENDKRRFDINNNKKELTTLTSSQKEISSSIDKVKTSQSTIKKSVDSVKIAMTDVKASQSTIKKSVNSVKVAMTNVNSKVSSFNGKINDNAGLIGSLEARLKKAQAKLFSLNDNSSKIASLDSKINGIKSIKSSELNSVKSELSKVQADNKALLRDIKTFVVAQISSLDNKASTNNPSYRAYSESEVSQPKLASTVTSNTISSTVGSTAKIFEYVDYVVDNLNRGVGYITLTGAKIYEVYKDDVVNNSWKITSINPKQIRLRNVKNGVNKTIQITK